MPKPFKVFYPIKPATISQPFGVNGKYYQDHGINVTGHPGIDFVATHGQPVYATHDGNAYYEIDVNQGHGVVIRTNEMFDDGNGGECFYKSISWHLCNPAKEPQFDSPITATDLNSQGQPVKAGDLIGYADNTGFSNGDHFHYAIKPVGKGEQNGTFYNLEQANGYFGAVNPEPFFNGFFAEDAQKVSTLQNQAVVAVSQVVEEISKDTKDTPAQKLNWLQSLIDFLHWMGFN